MTLYCIIFKIDSLEFVLARFFPFCYWNFTNQTTLENYSSIQPSVRFSPTSEIDGGERNNRSCA
jgi:hypothetical protein